MIPRFSRASLRGFVVGAMAMMSISTVTLNNSLAQTSRLTVVPQLEVGWQSLEQMQRSVLYAPAADAPKIDGELNDRNWIIAPKIDSFKRITGLAPDASRWVTVQATHDEERLYLAAVLAKPAGTFRAAITENGGRIWMDDALEIFLYDPQDGLSYQIDVNALGKWWAGSTADWKPDLTIAARIHDDHWTMELSLPWRDLGLNGPVERTMKLQFRYLVNGQSGSTSWVDADQWQTDGYGELALTAPLPDVAVDSSRSLKVLRYLQHSELPFGSSPEAAGVDLFNPTKSPLSAEVRLYRVNYLSTLHQPLSRETTMDGKQTVMVEPGERKRVTLSGVMPAEDPQLIRQTLYVRALDLHTQRFSVSLLQRTRDVGLMPAFRMQLQRERFYSGDPGVQGTLAIGIAQEAFESASLHVEFGSRRHIISEVKFDNIPSRLLNIGLDLTGIEPGEYQIISTLRTGQQVLERTMPIVVQNPWPLPEHHRIPVRVDLPAGLSDAGNIPMYVGVSFPGGTLHDLKNLRVINGRGDEMPSQVEALAHWGPGGSVRWAGIHFTTKANAALDDMYFIELGTQVGRQSPSGPIIQIQHTAEMIRIDTGVAQFEVPRTGPLLGDAWLGDRQVLVGGRPCLIVADQNGQVATELGASAEEAPQIETQGPQFVVIRREGVLRRKDGSSLGKYIVRLFFHAGASHVRVQHSFINTEDTMQVQYSDLALRVTPSFAGPWHVRMDRSPEVDSNALEATVDPSRGEAAYLAQTVFNHHGQHEQRYVIGIRRDEQWREVETGAVSGQWASVASASTPVGVAITLRNFVETFPSELEIGPEGLTAHIWTSRGGRLLDYRPAKLVDYLGKQWFDFNSSKRPSSPWKSGSAGMAALVGSAAGSARTHDLTIHLFAGQAQQASVVKVAQLTQEPALAIQDPNWLRITGAMGPLAAHNPDQFPRAERFIESFFRYHLVGQAKHWGNYGFLDHGSGPHGFRSGSHDYAEHSYPQLFRAFHFNYKFPSTPWRMYARSGDRMYFTYGDAKNRSLADYRWVHHPARGMKRGAMIVSETSFTLPLYWAGNESLAFQGQDIDNFIYQYYLTGDRWVHETVREFGQYMIENFDARSTRPAGDMYSYQPYMFLASLYEMNWDERLGEKLRAMRWTLDQQTTTGLMNWPSMSAWYKWYVEIFGPIRDYQVTGSHEARETFLKLAELSITHAPAGRHASGETMGYDDNFGLTMNLASQITGDPRYASYARDNFNTRLFWFSEESGETHRVGPFVAAHSPQGLDSLAYLMDLMARTTDSVARHPALPLGASESPMDVYFIKRPNHDAKIELVSGSEFDMGLTQLLNSGDKRKRLGFITLTTHPSYSPRDPQSGLDREDQYVRLLVPKEALPGQYRLTNVREICWSTAEQMVVVAPNGASLEISSAEPARWFFLLPATKHGALHADQPMILERAGSSETLAADTWHEIEGGGEDELIQIRPARAGFDPLPFTKNRPHTVMTRIIPSTVFIQFRGDIPPVLTAHDPQRFFLPRIIAPTEDSTKTRQGKQTEHDN